MKTKLCPKCQTNKPINNFYKSKRAYIDHYAWCKSCCKLTQIQRRLEKQYYLGLQNSSTHIFSLFPTGCPPPYQNINQNMVSQCINELLDTLKEKEKYILIHSFGLMDNNYENLIQISKALHISSERVRQIKWKAIDKIKKQAPKSLISSLSCELIA